MASRLLGGRPSPAAVSAGMLQELDLGNLPPAEGVFHWVVLYIVFDGLGVFYGFWVFSF